MKTPIKRLTYTTHGRCDHHPKRMFLVSFCVCDMQKANSPLCTTKRLWIYTRNRAWCFDWDREDTAAEKFLKEQLRLEKERHRDTKARDFIKEIADEGCFYKDNCPDFGTRHGKCMSCQAKEALKS